MQRPTHLLFKATFFLMHTGHDTKLAYMSMQDGGVKVGVNLNGERSIMGLHPLVIFAVKDCIPE